MGALHPARQVAAFIGLVGLLVTVLGPPAIGAGGAGLSAPAGRKPTSGVYIVRLAEDPVSSYEGGRPGFARTKPGRGEKIDSSRAHVRSYAKFLDNRHGSVLAAAGAAPDARFYDYRYSFNGFAADLTPAEVVSLRAMPGVLSVEADGLSQPLTDNTPNFLGLSTPGGLWEQVGGVGAAGEDVIIGVIDTGIWPEHPSFSDQADLAARPGYSGKPLRVYGAPPAGWNGTCQSGEQWSRADCNNKLIGARYFLDGFGHFGIIEDEYRSARDADGHGTHTASTAGGNAGADPSIFGNDLGVGTVSGMAPRARIAMYKACWNGQGCFHTDLVAAIDTAVADGVDVINYSIGGGPPSLLNPDAVSFLFAADAGVFAAAAAGNEGPGPSTVLSPALAPWLTAVGAGTHSRTFQGTVTLGNGDDYFGASVTGGTGVLSIVDAADASTNGSDQCLPGQLDPSAVAGKIVLCQRGSGFRIWRSQEVAAAGGAGMVLYNEVSPQEILTDNHFVPTVHTTLEDGLAIKDFIAAAGAGATAQIGAGTATADPSAPDMAAFSSRGPNGASGDVVKPDVLAPGVQVLAGNTPTSQTGAPGQLFQSIAGTSMSSPHVAGVAALLVQLHPDWTPAMVRSSLMTTGHHDVDKEDGATAADPFDIGAGHIAPTPAADPGLVYDADFFDYLGFLCGAGALSGCDDLAIDPSDLNLPSIGVAQLAGSHTVSREVTNVGPAATYLPTIEAPPGVTVEVSPASLPLAEDETATYAVTFTVTGTAELDAWAFGSLTWSDGAGHTVRSPIAVMPFTLAFPAEFTGTGAAGAGEWDVTFGYTGAFTAAVHGLIPSATQAGNVVDDPANDINVALETGVGITLHTVTVPTSTRHLRVSLFDGETDGADDLDVFLFDPDGEFVDQSIGVTAQEQVDVTAPASGEWTVVVHGWQTEGPDSNYMLFTWALGDADQGNLTATSPAAATQGATEPISVSWTGAATGTRYLGTVSYHDGTKQLGETLVAIAA